MSAERVDCRRCRHFHISWDPKAPYACGAHAFKSQTLPSLVVLQASGLPCQLFVRKTA